MLAAGALARRREAVAVQIMRSDAPLPPAGEFSEELRDFCRACLAKDPGERASAKQLLSHPWILKHRAAAVDMAAYVRSTMDPHAAFDELAFFFAQQYYQLLGTLLGGEPRAAAAAHEGIKALYTDASVYSMALEHGAAKRPTGRVGISARIGETMTLFRGWAVRALRVRTVDASVVPSGGGSVLVLVQGELEGGRAGARFSDSFLLAASTGDDGAQCMTIANQSFTLL
jgi:hypothetical protein